jgi:hypothetical protein
VTGLTSGLDSRLNVIEPIYITGGTGRIEIDGANAHNLCLDAEAQAILSSALTGTTGTYLETSNRNVCLDTLATSIIDNALTGATNGLTPDGNGRLVKLGGTLSEDTVIGMDNYTLTISGGSDPAYFKVYSSLNGSVEIGAGDTHFSVASGGDGIQMYNSAVNTYLVINSSFGIQMNSGATTVQIIHDKINLTGTVALVNTPAAGTTSDSILVRASDGTIKQISQNNLGKLIVTGDTTLTTSSPYVILVNHTAPVTITLPATPFDGQAFKIKDASNNALTNNITIARNGNNIDRQASNATINTDSGALELVYDSSLGWFTLAFVN